MQVMTFAPSLKAVLEQEGGVTTTGFPMTSAHVTSFPAQITVPLVLAVYTKGGTDYDPRLYVVAKSAKGERLAAFECAWHWPDNPGVPVKFRVFVHHLSMTVAVRGRIYRRPVRQHRCHGNRPQFPASGDQGQPVRAAAETAFGSPVDRADSSATERLNRRLSGIGTTISPHWRRRERRPRPRRPIGAATSRQARPWRDRAGQLGDRRHQRRAEESWRLRLVLRSRLQAAGGHGHIVALAAEADHALFESLLVRFGSIVRILPADRTSAFRLDYEDVDHRQMSVDAIGPVWGRSEIEAADPDTTWVHLAPLLRTDFPASTLALLAERGHRVAYDGQGLVRADRLGPLVVDRHYPPELLRHLSGPQARRGRGGHRCRRRVRRVDGQATRRSRNPRHLRIRGMLTSTPTTPSSACLPHGASRACRRRVPATCSRRAT